MSSIAAKKPDNPYGLSKACAEEWCKLYSKLYGIETIMIRPYNIYGKGGHGVINIFAKQKLEGKKLTIHGSGKQKRNFVHIDDITDTICALLEMKTGRLASIKNIAKMIEECPKKKLEELI
jgi:UDP-glucose 4-epimerase